MKQGDRSIAQHGEPILNQQAQKITLFDGQLTTLAMTMLNIMQEANGVGIAAPQIHHNSALFIMGSHPNERYPNAPLMKPEIIINPQIIHYSDKQELDEEGCLSVANKRLTISRHSQIEVRYQALDASQHQKILTGFIARIFQHEYDHLQGITIIERHRMQNR